MSEDNLLMPPIQYDLIWLVIAVSLVGLVVLFYTILLSLTSKIKPEDVIKPLPDDSNSPPVDRMGELKNRYVTQVLELQKKHDEGKVSTRKAFQSLSVLLRNFSHEYSKTGAFSMSLNDLERSSTPVVLTDKIRNFYPFAFEQANKTGNVKLAVEDTLKVIQLWH